MTRKKIGLVILKLLTKKSPASYGLNNESYHIFKEKNNTYPKKTHKKTQKNNTYVNSLRK